MLRLRSGGLPFLPDSGVGVSGLSGVRDRCVARVIVLGEVRRRCGDSGDPVRGRADGKVVMAWVGVP
eukprot:g20501.t1